MKILIVGAGIGGLALAAFLKQKNIPAEIIEKTPRWEHFGYSIGIWNNGRQMLEKLHLSEKFDALSKSMENYYLANGRGRVRRLYHFDAFRKKYWPAYSHITRKNLHDLLIEAAGGVRIRMNTVALSLRQVSDGVEVEFSDETKGVYDLVVGADGIHSHVRDAAFGEGYVHYTDWRAYFFWTDRRGGIPKGVFEMIEPAQFCAIFDERGDKMLVVLACPENHAVWDTPKDRLLRLQRHFQNCSWMLPQILKSVKAEDITPTDIAFVKMKNWVNKRVVLIGDAAHAMEPFAGMGASMAMEDAYVLAEELGKADAASVNEALNKYARRRFDRVELARSQTRALWWWAKFTSRAMCFFRNILIPYVPIGHFTKDYENLLKHKV